MGIVATVNNFFRRDFFSKAKEDFQIQSITSGQMEAWVNECVNIYKGNPCWLNPDDHIDTVDFAKAICSEVARLVTKSVGITLSGSARADWLQAQMEKIFFRLRHWVEYGCAYGTIILKPNGNSIDLFLPGQFTVTAVDNGQIRGIVFYDLQSDLTGERWYTRMEYHRFVDGVYNISNRCYIGYEKGAISRPIDLSLTPWKYLVGDVALENVERPLFGVFRTPQANNIDVDSPLGLPIFSEAVQELRDLDIAYSRNVKEIKDSKRTVLLDSNVMLPMGNNTMVTHYPLEVQREAMGLPDMVKNVKGDGVEKYYQEINPTLNTETRTIGINGLLNQIGFKCGFSNGHFVFNENTGIQTATQVEADQQRTIQLVKDVRDQLEDCIGGLVYALNVFADLYDLAPVGTYDLDGAIHFDDIAYSFEEDKLHHYNLAMQGKYPWEEYYVKYLKVARDEAKRLLDMAKNENKVPRLFGMEE